MNKRTSKILSVFWLVAGLIWVAAIVRHTTVKDDLIGAIIYLAAAVFSFILAFVYYRGFVK